MRDDYGPNRLSLRLAVRPFADAFRFAGRSTRTEVVSFWLLGLVCNALTVELVGFSDAVNTAYAIIGMLWAAVWSWPWVPLLVRRLHDQSRSGNLAWLNAALAVLFALLWRFAPDGKGPNISISWVPYRTARTIAWAPFTVTIVLLEIGIGIALLVLYLLPNTPGDNIYGPDPRGERDGVRAAETNNG